MKKLQSSLPIVALILLCGCIFSSCKNDVDADGIDDGLEKKLLEQFRPYYKFSNDDGNETFRPADVWWYITKSELLNSQDENNDPYTSNPALAANPEDILSPTHFEPGQTLPTIGPSVSGDILVTGNKPHTKYYLNPLEKIGGENEENPGRRGNTWQRVLSEKNTGLYGHVVPIKLTDPDNFNFDHVLNGADPGKTYFKIEYWQFFGYNSANRSSLDEGDHEGDWASVQVLFDPDNNKIISVFHFAYGLCFKFNLAKAVTNSVTNNKDGTVKEFLGSNHPVNIDLVSKDLLFNVNTGELGKAQNNILRMFQDPVTKEFSHPVVYIERGTHEFYPSEFWSYYTAPNHNGESYNFLTNTPPNLGEVEHILPETRSARVILRFNGKWGTYNGKALRKVNPPFGPALHKNFTWPASSSIRWQLRDLGF